MLCVVEIVENKALGKALKNAKKHKDLKIKQPACYKEWRKDPNKRYTDKSVDTIAKYFINVKNLDGLSYSDVSEMSKKEMTAMWGHEIECVGHVRLEDNPTFWRDKRGQHFFQKPGSYDPKTISSLYPIKPDPKLMEEYGVNDQFANYCLLKATGEGTEKERIPDPDAKWISPYVALKKGLDMNCNLSCRQPSKKQVIVPNIDLMKNKSRSVDDNDNSNKNENDNDGDDDEDDDQNDNDNDKDNKNEDSNEDRNNDNENEINMDNSNSKDNNEEDNVNENDSNDSDTNVVTSKKEEMSSENENENAESDEAKEDKTLDGMDNKKKLKKQIRKIR